MHVNFSLLLYRKQLVLKDLDVSLPRELNLDDGRIQFSRENLDRIFSHVEKLFSLSQTIPLLRSSVWDMVSKIVQRYFSVASQLGQSVRRHFPSFYVLYFLERDEYHFPSHFIV